MRKFYILEVENRGRKNESHKFVEVEGEVVDIGENIQAFARNMALPSDVTDLWKICDLETGTRLTSLYPLKDEAIESAKRKIEQTGLQKYSAKQQKFIEKYGRSPAMESA